MHIGRFPVCRLARIKQIVWVYLSPRATLNEVALVMLQSVAPALCVVCGVRRVHGVCCVVRGGVLHRVALCCVVWCCVQVDVFWSKCCSVRVFFFVKLAIFRITWLPIIKKNLFFLVKKKLGHY